MGNTANDQSRDGYYRRAIMEEQKDFSEAKAKPQREYKQMFQFCDKQLKCGHRCKGVCGEEKCLPCLDIECEHESHYQKGIDEFQRCKICMKYELGADACSRLSCGHVFHTGCLVQRLKERWYTKRITFVFICCPTCDK